LRILGLPVIHIFFKVVKTNIFEINLKFPSLVFLINKYFWKKLTFFLCHFLNIPTHVTLYLSETASRRRAPSPKDNAADTTDSRRCDVSSLATCGTSRVRADAVGTQPHVTPSPLRQRRDVIVIKRTWKRLSN
jgi:hypothetical protein